MKRYLLLLLLVSMNMIQACAPKPQSDCGFVQNVYGERISWKGDIPVKMVLHESVPDEMIPAIKNATETWNKTAGKTIVEIDYTNKEQGPVTPRKDGRNVIYLMNTWESEKGSEQGRTSVYWIGDQIKETDIRLNGANFTFYWEDKNGETVTSAARAGAASVNMEALVLHEMGHVLGLKHRDNQGSVMATYLRAKEDRVDLASADTQSLQCEY